VQPRENSGDSPARFLAELRALRDQSALSHTELAARAHYPIDVLQAAEVGPSLPDLPVLSAYVRACGGEVTEWEDRWRVLSGVPAEPLSSPGLPSRPAGGSAAASAGARVGATALPVDEQESAFIMAVLARVTAASAASASAAPPTSAPSTPAGPAPSASPTAPAPPPPPPVPPTPVPSAPVPSAPVAPSMPTPAPAGVPATAPVPPPAPPPASVGSMPTAPMGRAPGSARVAARGYRPPASRGFLDAIPRQAQLPLLIGVVIVVLIILIITLS
jgi:hypothetical protein